MITNNPIVEAVLKRDRMIVSLGLAAILMLAAYITFDMAQYHNNVAAAVLEHHHQHGNETPDGFWHLFGMWTVMQVAMMSPTAVPMLLMHVKVQRSRRPAETPYLQTIIFFVGYLIVWTAFSAAIAGVQVYLQSTSLLTPQMTFVSPWLAGGILIAAGLFQFSKLKEVCLNSCRSPVTYLMLEWREDNFGALMMGLKHGLHCVGCCWVLMALLFVAGVMNLLWMSIITVFVLLEKVMPKGELFGKVGGIAMILWGAVLVIL
jgi:predicted metal-binding membrane protein